MLNKKKLDIIEFLLWIGIIININLLASQFFFRLDFTEDQRYSLAPTSINLAENIDDKLEIEIFLTGELNPNYNRLKNAFIEKVEQFKIYAPQNITYKFTDPNAEPNKQQREQFYYQLSSRGIQPKYFLEEKNGQREEKYIFPGAIVKYKEKETPVQLLKGNQLLPEAELLNQSIENIEFEIANALRKLGKKNYQNIAIIQGHGEWNKDQIGDFSNSLSENYSVNYINLKTDSTELNQFKTILITGGGENWTDNELYQLDQYVMNGGKLLICMDGPDTRKDSLKSGVTYSLVRENGLNNLLFKYGVRINQDLIEDAKSGITKIQTGLNGEMQMLNFPYFPICYNYSKHPIVKNLDAIQTKFISSIDTVKADAVKKTPLIFTSDKSNIIAAPSQIDLDLLRKSQSEDYFKDSNIPVAYLLEGQFTSLYKGRRNNKPNYKPQSSPTSIIVIADADICKNEYDPTKKKIVPLGYNVDMRYMFSNKELLLNAVDFLMGEKILNAKNKEVILRPLDDFEINNNKTYWQIINIIAPIIIVIIGGVLIFYRRKNKYTKN